MLTGRTINEETSAIGNPTRINAKGDDVLGMIAQLSAKNDYVWFVQVGLHILLGRK